MFNAVWVSVLAEIMRRIGLKTQSVMCKLYWLAFHACHVGAFAGDCALQVIQRTACCKNQLNRLHNINHTQNCLIRGCAYKSLARPRRKKTTETKLGIYSTHSHEAQYTSQPVAVSFASHLKKIRSLSVQPGLCGSNDLCVGRKMAALQWFYFQSREHVVVRRDQVRRIGCVIKTLEAQIGQFLLGCKCPVSRGIVVQEQNPLG